MYLLGCISQNSQAVRDNLFSDVLSINLYEITENLLLSHLSRFRLALVRQIFSEYCTEHVVENRTWA